MQRTLSSRARISRQTSHPAAVGQPDVQDGDVRTGGRDPGQRVGRGARLADHLQVRLAREQVPYAASYDFMVVDQENPYFSLFAHGSSLTHEVFPCRCPPG